MCLPEKSYFFPTELATRWNTDLRDIQYYGENGLLEICVKYQTLKVALGEYVMIKGDGLTKVQRKIKLSPAPHPLHPVDVYRVFQAEGAPVTITRLKTNDALKFITIHHEEGVPVSSDDMVVTKKERQRFEMKYQITPFEGEHYPIFSARNHCSEIYIRGEHHNFGPVQARIIEQLYEASLSNEPWIHGKELLRNAGSAGLRIAGLFNHHKGWREVILSNKRGYYRLNVPLLDEAKEKCQLTFNL